MIELIALLFGAVFILFTLFVIWACIDKLKQLEKQAELNRKIYKAKKELLGASND